MHLFPPRPHERVAAASNVVGKATGGLADHAGAPVLLVPPLAAPVLAALEAAVTDGRHPGPDDPAVGDRVAEGTG